MFADRCVRIVQWSKMHNFQRMGKNCDPVLSHLQTKFRGIIRQCRRPLAVSNPGSNFLYHVSFRRYRPLNLPLSCEVVGKGVFDPRFVGEGIPRMSDMHFQMHSLPHMWPVLVEFHRASLAGSWQVKGDRRRRIAVKPEATDDYVGCPENYLCHTETCTSSPHGLGH